MKSKLVYSKSSFIVNWVLIAALFVVGVLAVFWKMYFFSGAMLLISVIAATARLWAEMSAKKINVSVKSDVTGLFPGETAEFSIEIENEKFLPVLWIDAFFPLTKKLCFVPIDSRYPEEWEKTALREENLSETKVGELKFSSFLWYEKQKTFSKWKAESRGIYSNEYWKIRSGDGLGLAQIEQPIRKEDIKKIAVYPKIIPVKKELFLKNSWDAVTGERGNLEDNTAIRSTRPYTAADNIKNINWRLLARNMPLSVNVYEEIMPQSAFFIIDGESFSGYEKHLAELEDMLSIIGSEILALKTAGVGVSLSISKGIDSPEQTALFDSDTESLLWLLAGYDPMKDITDENLKVLDQKSIMDREGIFEQEAKTGKFYYVVYNTDKISNDSVLYDLGPERAVILAYEKKVSFGEYTIVPLNDLKGE